MNRAKTPLGKRRAARLAAVQALYQIDMSDASVDAALSHSVERVRDAESGELPGGEIDEDLLSDLVRGGCSRRGEVDDIVQTALSGNWTIERLEVVLRAILRAGAYELLARPDIDAPVTINEYVEMANAFFDGGESKLVNGVLDRIAVTLRSAGAEPRAGNEPHDAEDG